MARCQATTKSGARCKRTAAEGEDRCSVHNRARAKSADPAPGTAANDDGGKRADQGASASQDTSKKSASKKSASKKSASKKSTSKKSTSKKSTSKKSTSEKDTSKKGFRSKHINSGQDLLHLAIGAAATLAMLWLLKRAPRPPGF